MSAVTLTRRYAARNLHRYYRLDVQPDSFGDWCFIREWAASAAPGKHAASPTLLPTERKLH